MAKLRVAVLVDAENIGSKHWTTVSEAAAKLGQVNACRLFGDFSDARLANWVEIARNECLDVSLQLSRGKNCTDIALAVAAMDVFHGGRTDVICLVTSDQDFVPLVLRLRSGGIAVHGFGYANTSLGLQKACTGFAVLGAPAAQAGKVKEPA